MDKSLNEDIFRARSLGLGKVNLQPAAINVDENEGTLDLSPIHKTEKSFSENSVELNRRAQTEVDNRIDKESIVASVVPPLSHSTYKVTRKRKYYHKDSVPVDNFSDNTNTATAKNRYSHSATVAKERKPVHTFKDLFQYENFQEILLPINEEQESDSSKQAGDNDKNNRPTAVLPYKNKFYIPKDDESNPFESTVKQDNNSNFIMNRDSDSGQNKVRRYGKYRYSSNDRDNSNIQASASSTFDRRQDRTIEVQDDCKRNKNGEKQATVIDPVFKNITYREELLRTTTFAERLHVYEIDPMAVEFGPGQAESFRSKKTYQSSIGRESFRTNNNDETPRKSLLKHGRQSHNSIGSSGSAKKTVRFAESSEGLLRVVPIDPTFNESDFVYEMRYNLD